MCVTRAILIALLALTAFASPPPGEQQNLDLLGLPELLIPASNPQTPEKIKLGDKLFHDTRFSGDGRLSCASCHTSTARAGDIVLPEVAVCARCHDDPASLRQVALPEEARAG